MGLHIFLACFKRPSASIKGQEVYCQEMSSRVGGYPSFDCWIDGGTF